MYQAIYKMAAENCSDGGIIPIKEDKDLWAKRMKLSSI